MPFHCPCIEKKIAMGHMYFFKQNRKENHSVQLCLHYILHILWGLELTRWLPWKATNVKTESLLFFSNLPVVSFPNSLCTNSGLQLVGSMQARERDYIILLCVSAASYLTAVPPELSFLTHNALCPPSIYPFRFVHFLWLRKRRGTYCSTVSCRVQKITQTRLVSLLFSRSLLETKTLATVVSCSAHNKQGFFFWQWTHGVT